MVCILTLIVWILCVICLIVKTLKIRLIILFIQISLVTINFLYINHKFKD